MDSPSDRSHKRPLPREWSHRAEPVGDRQPPIPAERLGRHPDTRGCLPPLTLGTVDQPDDLQDRFLWKPLGDKLVDPLVPLDVALQNPVEDLVRRQRVLVELIWTKLGRGRALEDRHWDEVAPFLLVAP